MTRFSAWLDERFEAATPTERAEWTGLALATAIFLVHFAVLSWWYVEDAAISFSFARNLVNGEGLVAVPGGERVEGFSNPTWTALLALFYALGITPWIMAKVLGVTFGTLTLPLSLKWVRRVLPENRGSSALIAPFLLATCPQFVIWAGSGLENSLFVLLLAFGATRIFEEAEEGGFPWSAPALMLLAITRPEAPMYAGVVGAYGLAMLILWRRPLGYVGKWLLGYALLGAVPFFAFHAARYSYFEWPWPNTYYAKLADTDKFDPWGWKTRGWKYLRDYSFDSGQGFLLPFYVVGATGVKGWRIGIAVGAVVVGGLFIAPGLEWPSFLPFWPLFADPAWLIKARILWIVAFALILPVMSLGRPRASARILAWGIALLAAFFVVFSGGDWMEGYRWLSMATVPMAVLLADAAFAIGEGIADFRGWGRWSDGAMGLIILTPVLVGLGQSISFILDPETMPYDVRRRVLFMQGVEERLGLDHVALLDVDMGAHMWWSGFDLVDMAGLIDVPMAHHKWERPFVQQYVYQEWRPEFAHVHGSWASRTSMTSHPEWHQYLEIEAYPVSPWTVHPGNTIRKDLVAVESWPGTPARHAGFEGELQLVGLDVPAPEVAAGEELYVEVGWSRQGDPEEFRAVLFLSGNGRTFARELPPAYDWMTTKDWRKGQVILGRHSLSLPDDLPPGDYDLGVVLMAPNGAVIAATDAGTGTLGAPEYAKGEVRWAGVVHVLPLADTTKLADDGVQWAIDLADHADCKGAETTWASARRHLARDNPWQADAHARLDAHVADCWARAATKTSGKDQIDKMKKALRWDHLDPEVERIGASIAKDLAFAGQVSYDRGDMTAAYDDWRDAVRVDPWRADLRHKAEDARDHSLRIGPDDQPAPVVMDKPGG